MYILNVTFHKNSSMYHLSKNKKRKKKTQTNIKHKNIKPQINKNKDKKTLAGRKLKVGWG